MINYGTITTGLRIMYQRMKGGFKMAFGAAGLDGAHGGIGAGIAAVVVIILLLIAMGIVF